MKKTSLNQYINENELKSLIIRINNKTFMTYLSLYFEELDKAITENNNNNIIDIFKKIIKTKKYQLLLLSDEQINLIKQLLENNNTNELLKILIPLNDKIKMKITKLKNVRRSDLTRLNKYLHKNNVSKNQKFKRILRNHIINISERTIIDKKSYERFGELVLLIIKNILKKPKFSGYTYRDEFYSDSTDKIFRYIKNFNHELISDRTGQTVNAFSYISQYVHNSILFIIKSNSAEQQAIQTFINSYNREIGEELNVSKYQEKSNVLTKHLTIENDLLQSIKENLNTISIDNYTDLVFYYKNYNISIKEYEEILKLKKDIKCTLSIIKDKNE